MTQDEFIAMSDTHLTRMEREAANTAADSLLTHPEPTVAEYEMATYVLRYEATLARVELERNLWRHWWECGNGESNADGVIRIGPSFYQHPRVASPRQLAIFENHLATGRP